MHATHAWLRSMALQLQQLNARQGLVLHGSRDWQHYFISALKAEYEQCRVAWLGNSSAEGGIGFKKGAQLLGQELDILVVELDGGFDANSFTAALGAIVGGGVLIVLPYQAKLTESDYASQWLDDCLAQLLQVEQGRELPELNLHLPESLDVPFADQQLAIENIVRVIEGHRKRPLVITADRGRGKSSALGIATASLISRRSLRVAVTAPQSSSVEPVFSHAAQRLPDATRLKNKLVCANSSIEFIAPDALLRSEADYDLVLVDEAAALPLPILQAMVERFHRLVFSSTIHGYEGSGRGFTLKFLNWLKQHRPNSRHQHLSQPIRWRQGDPLEAWSFSSFLLDAELEPFEPVAIEPDCEQFSLLSKSVLRTDKSLLRQSFALLVSAHYQTSPNDLFSFLADPRSHLYCLMTEGRVAGCILTVEEGRLEEEMIEAIALGKRRPAGQLAVTSMINHLGCLQAGKASSQRIMRIAIDPSLQGRGLGSTMLQRLTQQHIGEFISTSFAMSEELVSFWKRNGFVPLKLGHQRDASSGCYSLLMVSGSADYTNLESHFRRQLPHWLSGRAEELSAELIAQLIDRQGQRVNAQDIEHLTRYAQGGSSLESVRPILYDILLRLSARDLTTCSELLLKTVVCQMPMTEACRRFALAGKKQFEQQLRLATGELITQLSQSNPIQR
ncbi:GNAT family N-acetyltransferase [Vibrio sp. WXL103]|uniref:GNAT family N-acetyltransferase n=1 Tax=Vibrio sp. WXL103 TaxID=3450710 RepID=UPI003EC54085